MLTNEDRTQKVLEALWEAMVHALEQATDETAAEDGREQAKHRAQAAARLRDLITHRPQQRLYLVGHDGTPQPVTRPAQKGA